MRKEKIVQDVSKLIWNDFCFWEYDRDISSTDSCGNKGLACFNGGTCDEASSTCSCLAGFGGSDCRAGIEIDCIWY